MVVSDWTSILELVNHRVAKDGKDAARMGILAGNDMDMHSEVYLQYLEELANEDPAVMEAIDTSVLRVLVTKLAIGLFENPYLDPEESQRTVGCLEHCEAGFAAQLKSVVLLKNNGVLPIRQRKQVYIPNRHMDSRMSFFRTPLPPMDLPGADRDGAERFYDWADTPEEADFAIVFIDSPVSDGYREETGYRPVTLQYRPYTAHTARSHSIGQGDFRESDHPDRSYRGKSNTPANASDLDLVLNTRKAMGTKPVILVVRMHNPCVLAELETAADAIVVDFGVQQDAVLTILSGKAEPSGLLPVQLPRDMETVEAHCEDKPFDMEPYVDSLGNVYDFGFGLNWSGVIADERAQRYPKN
jgi:beta-glucosidase